MSIFVFYRMRSVLCVMAAVAFSMLVLVSCGGDNGGGSGGGGGDGDDLSISDDDNKNDDKNGPPEFITNAVCDGNSLVTEYYDETDRRVFWQGAGIASGSIYPEIDRVGYYYYDFEVTKKWIFVYGTQLSCNDLRPEQLVQVYI